MESSKKTLQEYLRDYKDIIYKEEVLGEDREKYKEQLDEIFEALEKQPKKIETMAFASDGKGNLAYPNALLYFLDSPASKTKDERGRAGLTHKLHARGVELAGLRYVKHYAHHANSTYETNVRNVDSAIKVLIELLNSKDPNIVNAAIEILRDPNLAAFNNRYLETMFEKQKQQELSAHEQMIINLVAPLSAPKGTITDEQRKISAIEFLEEVRTKVNSTAYDTISRNHLGDIIHTTSPEILKLRSALKNLNKAKDLKSLKEIYEDVKTTIENISKPDRQDDVERFYASEKKKIKDVKDDEKSKLNYLNDLHERLEGYAKMGKGGSVPANIKKLQDIYVKYITAENQKGGVNKFFKEVKDALDKIQPEQSLELRGLFNNLRASLQNSEAPNKNDEVKLQQVSRLDFGL